MHESMLLLLESMLPLLASVLPLLASIGWLLGEKVLTLASMYSRAWSLNQAVLYYATTQTIYSPGQVASLRPCSTEYHVSICSTKTVSLLKPILSRLLFTVNTYVHNQQVFVYEMHKHSSNHILHIYVCSKKIWQPCLSFTGYKCKRYLVILRYFSKYSTIFEKCRTAHLYTWQWLTETCIQKSFHSYSKSMIYTLHA